MSDRCYNVDCNTNDEYRYLFTVDVAGQRLLVRLCRECGNQMPIGGKGVRMAGVRN